MSAQLIVLLIALAASIISGINKNKRKQRAQQQGLPHEPAPQDDPWATIRKYIEDAQADPRQEPVPAPARVEPVQQKAAQQPSHVSALNEYAAKKKAEKKSQQKKIVAPAPEPASEKAAPAFAADDLLEDFDLRKAVIYSEILKPKYEEF